MKPIYNKTALENMIALVKASNPDVEITPDQLTLTTPVTNPDTNLTTLKLVAKEDQGYSGDIAVTYNRLTLDQYITNGEFIKVDAITTLENLIEDITSTLGIVKDDINISLVSTPDTTTSSMVLLEFSISKGVIYQDIQDIRVYVIDSHFDEDTLHRTGIDNTIRVTSEGKLRKVTPPMTPLTVVIQIPELEGFDT